MSVESVGLDDVFVCYKILKFFENKTKTSLPYFGVKLSCVCLMFAYRKK